MAQHPYWALLLRAFDVPSVIQTCGGLGRKSCQAPVSIPSRAGGKRRNAKFVLVDERRRKRPRRQAAPCRRLRGGQGAAARRRVLSRGAGLKGGAL